MGHKSVHALFICPKKPFPPLRRQSHGRADSNEVFQTHHPGVDCPNDHRVRDQRPEAFKQVQGERRSAKARLMEEADERIEANAVTCDREVFGQQAVRKREQGIDRIKRGTPIAIAELELERRLALAVLGLQHSVKVREVDPGRVAFYSEKLFEVFSIERRLRVAFELAEHNRRRLEVIAPQ